jgi:hypothetical protein
MLVLLHHLHGNSAPQDAVWEDGFLQVSHNAMWQSVPGTRPRTFCQDEPWGLCAVIVVRDAREGFEFDKLIPCLQPCEPFVARAIELLLGSFTADLRGRNNVRCARSRLLQHSVDLQQQDRIIEAKTVVLVGHVKQCQA